MNIKRGDIILVDYLFSDRTGTKVRPCLVIQNDRNNQRLDDTIVACILPKSMPQWPKVLEPSEMENYIEFIPLG